MNRYVHLGVIHFEHYTTNFTLMGSGSTQVWYILIRGAKVLSAMSPRLWIFL